jgi:tetratricopeptide (TPR) repeat protein
MSNHEQAEPGQDSPEKYHAAMAALRGGELAEADRLGDELLLARHTGGFEVKALAAKERGDLDGAVQLLEEGVKHGGDVWLLWQLLGNVESDRENLCAADRAYEKALGCEGANEASVRLNQAVLTARKGDLEGALELVESVDPGDNEELGEAVTDFHLWCLRSKRDVALEAGKVFELMLDAPTDTRMDEHDGPLRFMQRVHVAAPALEDALAAVARDLGEEYLGARVDESSELQDAAGLLEGVYWISGRHLYPEGVDGD